MTTADRPARFLMPIIDARGTVPPSLGLAAELIRRGHQVRVLADPTIEESALSSGCAGSRHFETSSSCSTGAAGCWS